MSSPQTASPPKAQFDAAGPNPATSPQPQGPDPGFMSGGGVSGGMGGGVGTSATSGLGSDGAGNAPFYTSGDTKKSYAKKLKPGEKPETQASADVQKASAPLQHADWMAQNQNLPAEPPKMAMAAPSQDRFMANFDHCTFSNDVVRRQRSFGARGGSRMGSMGGSQMGSMYGMGGGGFMYGMNPIMGSMYSRPASLFGSMGGPMMMGGSMYGMNPMMGSMYGMGGPMMGGPMMGGSMYGPYGGGMGSMYSGSMYGMNSGYGSFASSGLSGSGYGSAYNGASNMGGGSLYAPNGPDSMYGPAGMYGQGNAAGAPTGSMYGANSMYGGKDQAPANASRGLPSASATTPGVATTTPRAANTRQTEPVSSVLVLAPPSGAPTVNQSGPTSVVVAGKPSTFGEVILGQDSASAVAAWRAGESYKGFAQNVSAGHNTSLLVAAGATPGEQAPALALVHAALSDAVTRIELGARSDPTHGYCDGQFFCCALSSADKGVDLLGGNPNAAPTDIVIGSNPIFGPGFMKLSPKVFTSLQEFQPLLDNVMKAVPQVGANAPEKPVIAFELVLKQVRAAATGGGATDVLISSVLIFYNTNVTGQKAYFTAFRNDQAIPPSLVKNAIGGACRTSAILCLSASAQPPAAQAAIASLSEAAEMKNAPPRSGNVARFVTFARGEADKLKQRKDADPAVISRVETMLADSEKLVKNPRQEHPKPYPISPRSRQNSFNATPSTQANPRGLGSGAAGAGAVPTGSGPTSSGPTGSGPTGASRGVPEPNAARSAAAPSAMPAAAAAAPAAAAPSPAAAAPAPAAAAQPGSDNIVKLALVASPQGGPGGQTWTLGDDGQTITSATGASCTVDEVVVRTPDDWRSGPASQQVSQLQSMFQDGNNTAIIGTASLNDPNTLDKQPLWMSYKRMISSLLSETTQKYVFAEVSLSVTLVNGSELMADLLHGADQEGGAVAPAQSPIPLTVAVSPLFGPTVYKSATIKPPTPLQLESTVNNALHQVPLYMQQAANPENAIVFACAILKGVTGDDVYTSSLVAASVTNPQVFVDIMGKKPGTPYELFDYALRGPCCTLFLGDIIQGDANIDAVVNLMNGLRASPNRSVRSCSVRKFVAFAEDSLRKSEEKAAKASSETEKAHILKSKKSMEVFYTEYKSLLEDPQNKDPKTYRKSGSGGGSHSHSGGAGGAAQRRSTRPDVDAVSNGSRGSRRTASSANKGKRTSSSKVPTRKNSSGSVTKDAKKSSSSSKSKDKENDKKSK